MAAAFETAAILSVLRYTEMSSLPLGVAALITRLFNWTRVGHPLETGAGILVATSGDSRLRDEDQSRASKQRLQRAGAAPGKCLSEACERASRGFQEWQESQQRGPYDRCSGTCSHHIRHEVIHEKQTEAG